MPVLLLGQVDLRVEGVKMEVCVILIVAATTICIIALALRSPSP
jgi:hypothetical protein